MEFDKYHGLGNDFALIERGPSLPEVALLRRICDRHEGVGADGVIVCGPLEGGRAQMIIFNRDGTRPQMCGNGVRCVVARLADAGRIEPGGEVTVVSDAGPRRCELVGGAPGRWQVAVDMGPAALERGRGPIRAGGVELEWVDVDVGNPHAVVFSQPDLEIIDRIGRDLNDAHPAFEQGVNVEFVRRGEGGALDTIVYERGVGRTRACGTGACAVAAAAWREGVSPDGRPVQVRLPGGALQIERRGDHIWMTGPAERVFTGALAAHLAAVAGSPGPDT